MGVADASDVDLLRLRLLPIGRYSGMACRFGSHHYGNRSGCRYLLLCSSRFARRLRRNAKIVVGISIVWFLLLAIRVSLATVQVVTVGRREQIAQQAEEYSATLKRGHLKKRT